MRRIAALMLIGSGLWWGTTAQAQVLVYDALNFTQNATTALQQTLNTIEAVLQTGYMVLELTGMDDLALDDEFYNDLAALQGLVGDGAAVAWDLQSITAQTASLFGLSTAPDSSRLLAQRQKEIRSAVMAAHTTAVRVQTLMRTAAHTVRHIQRLVSRISAFVGNMQANQDLNESLASLNRLEATQTATNTAFQRAMTMQAMEAPLVQESLTKINQHFCGRWCQ